MVDAVVSNTTGVIPVRVRVPPPAPSVLILIVTSPPADLAAFADQILARTLLKHPLKKVPQLAWHRYRTTAGIADFRHWTIRLSVLVLDDPEKLERTLLHEYAHLLAVDRVGRRGSGHGPAWQQAMRDLGQDPVRTHDYACQRNQPRQMVLYKCSRCGMSIPRRRRLPRQRRYLHRACGGEIQLETITLIGP